MQKYKIKMQYEIVFETEVEIIADNYTSAIDAVEEMGIPKTQFNVISSSDPKVSSISRVNEDGKV